MFKQVKGLFFTLIELMIGVELIGVGANRPSRIPAELPIASRLRGHESGPEGWKTSVMRIMRNRVVGPTVANLTDHRFGRVSLSNRYRNTGGTINIIYGNNATPR